MSLHVYRSLTRLVEQTGEFEDALVTEPDLDLRPSCKPTVCIRLDVQHQMVCTEIWEL